MMGKTHRIWGAHHGLYLGAAVGSLHGPGVAALTALSWAGLGYLTATVPDAVERLPGVRVPHRTVTHWPELPLAGLALSVGFLPLLAGVLLGGGCAGVLSHWWGDLAFGKAHVSKGPDGQITGIIRPRGVPYLLGTRYFGLGIKVGSPGEDMFRKFLMLTFPLSVIGVLVLIVRSA